MSPKKKWSVPPQALDQGQDLVRAVDQALGIGLVLGEAQPTGVKERVAMMSSSNLQWKWCISRHWNENAPFDTIKMEKCKWSTILIKFTMRLNSGPSSIILTSPSYTRWSTMIIMITCIWSWRSQTWVRLRIGTSRKSVMWEMSRSSTRWKPILKMCSKNHSPSKVGTMKVSRLHSTCSGSWQLRLPIYTTTSRWYTETSSLTTFCSLHQQLKLSWQILLAREASLLRESIFSTQKVRHASLHPNATSSKKVAISQDLLTYGHLELYYTHLWAKANSLFMDRAN